ncbi:MAG: RsmD family RNA methyltransferase [Planctomycetales bacterium]|nr:RsmD family RNA methyltransferase [Planctomycetales bacterium]
MAKRRRNEKQLPAGQQNRPSETTLRIVGGSMRGRKIKYSGDQTVRPMKDRTREAVFNLVGPAINGMHAVDLFAGTGAMAIEAISRGAVGATLIERHLPSARVIRENLETLGICNQCQLIRGNAFFWDGAEADKEVAWCVFCCPPYRFFHDQADKLHELIARILDIAPVGSILVAEAEIPYDFTSLQELGDWDVRTYRPAVIGVLEKLQ